MQLVLASANPDKSAEIVAILSGVEVLPRPPELADVEETGATLEENALLKARAVAEHTGRPAVADDTGLEVRALGGAPGVLSARYAGPGATYSQNVTKVLEALAGAVDRRARFRTVAVVCFPDGSAVSAEGIVDGTIALTPRGTGGFGYDPVFVPDAGGGRTFAEMDQPAKNAVSHRGRAFRALAERLEGEGMTRSD